MARRIREAFSDWARGGDEPRTLPVDPEFGTPFQRRVWAALREIPRGRVATYGQVAAYIGAGAETARAVGGACGANPAPIVVPCHRVVALESPGGFGPGVKWKIRLLDAEGVKPDKRGLWEFNVRREPDNRW